MPIEISPLRLLAFTALILAGLAVAGLVWVALVRWYYRLREPRPTRTLIQCADGWELALYHRAPTVRRYREPVILVHGLAANHYTFDFDPPYSLAHALADAGFECFSVELRGTGHSARPPRGKRRSEWTVDDHVRLDAPAALAQVLERTGADRAFWVGHSLGGLVGYALAQGPEGSRLAGMVALGSPVYFRFSPWLQVALTLGAVTSWPFRLRHTLVSIALAPFLGYVDLPLSEAIANTRNIEPRTQRQVYAHLMSAMGHRVLTQFRDWFAHDAFRSYDRKTDWRAGIQDLRLPLLVLGGSADVLAPPSATEGQFALAGSPDKTLVLLGTTHGAGADYGHGDLLYGRNVARDVHPRIRDWLAARATPASIAESGAFADADVTAGGAEPARPG